MKADEIIFGIELKRNEELNIATVYFGIEDTWNKTKDAYNSQIFLEEGEEPDEELINILDEIEDGSYNDFITLSYDIYTDKEIDLEELKQDFIDSGFKYNSEFEKAIIEVMDEENNNSTDLVPIIPIELKYLYQKVVELAKNWLVKKREEENQPEYSFNQPIQSLERIWGKMTNEEKKKFGENPNFEIYYYENNIYIVVDETWDCSPDRFGIDFQKALYEEIIKEYGE